MEVRKIPVQFVVFIVLLLGTFFVILANGKLNMCDLCLLISHKWYSGDTEMCWLFQLCDAWNVCLQTVSSFVFFVSSLSSFVHIAFSLDCEKISIQNSSIYAICYSFFDFLVLPEFLMSILFLVCLILKKLNMPKCTGNHGIWVKKKETNLMQQPQS